MSKSVMPSSHLILCCPLFLLPLIFPSIRVFTSESALHIRWPKYWNFSYVGVIFQMFISSINFPCEAGHLRIDALKLWCWRRLLRAPWTARRSNQSILKDINPECSLEGLMLKLKLQYFGHLMRTADTLEKSLMLGKMEGRRRRGRQRMRWLGGITDAMNMNLSKLRDGERREAWRAAAHGVTKSQTQLGDWTTSKWVNICKMHRALPSTL